MLHLPQHIRHRIYAAAIGSDKVELEVNAQGALLTCLCRLLNISTAVRKDVLEACKQGELKLVYTFRSPASFASISSQLTSNSHLTLKIVRVLLLADIDKLALTLTEGEERGDDVGPNFSPLFKAWREAFRTLPQHSSIELAYFDCVRSFRLNPNGISRLVHLLSAILRQRTQGIARCRIIGCKTVDGQRFIENSTVNVIHARADFGRRKRRFNIRAEYDAGPPLIRPVLRPDGHPADIDQVPVPAGESM